MGDDFPVWFKIWMAVVGTAGIGFMAILLWIAYQIFQAVK